MSVVCPSFLRTNLASSLRGADDLAEAGKERYLTRAKRTPEVVAARVLNGVDAGRYLILTDREGRIAYWAKRFATPLYRRAMAAPGRRMAAIERKGGANR